MTIPEHIAIIMDGNGRWAKKRFLPKSSGHKAGAQNLKSLAYKVEERGVKYLTVYAFSTENWKRSDEEVNDLMNLLRNYIKDYINDEKKNDMKIDVIGDMRRLPEDLQESIEYLKELTKNKTGLTMIIALNYGGRDEITRTIKSIVEKNIDPENITEDLIRENLDTKNYPDPDLVIRTSGEYRISNFLLWQAAYSEFYFTDKLWPDFKEDDLDKAIEAFNFRERRFGGRK